MFFTRTCWCSSMVLLFHLSFGTAIYASNLKPIRQLQDFTKFLRDQCACATGYNCRCCVQVINNILNRQDNVCFNWKIQPNTSAAKLLTNVTLNDKIILDRLFSANDLPPICFPLMPPMPLNGCIKINDLKQHPNNQKWHVCANATLSVVQFDLLNFRIVCMDFGSNGIEIHNEDEDEAMPEISLVTVDGIKQQHK